MSQDFYAQILETIKKNLPETQVGALKEYLLESEEIRRNNKKLLDENANLHKQVIDFQRMDSEYQKLKTMEQNNEARDKALNKREDKLELELLKNKYESSINSRNDIYNLVDRFVRANEIREYITRHEPGYQGDRGWIQDRNITETSDIKKEKTK